MSHTLYATFARPEDAEKAAGALLDHGARAEDLSVVRNPSEGFSSVTEPRTTASNVSITDGDDVTATPAASTEVAGPRTEKIEDVAEHGITTTTAGDAGAAAVQGTIIGAGVGAVIAIASLIVPGVGFVLGAGALASAIGGIAATAGAGAAAGAIVGYLKDMGVDDQVATEYGQTVESGGAVLAVNVPTGNVDEAAAESILSKYAATNVNRYASRGYVA